MKKQYIQPTLKDHKLQISACLEGTIEDTINDEEGIRIDEDNSNPATSKAGYFDAWD